MIEDNLLPLVLTKRKAIFFAHVPKTGGSSVEDYLTRRFGPLAMVDRHKRRGVRGTGLITAVTHLSARDLEEMIPPGIDLCFALVRDPLSRVLSEYRWQTSASRMSRFPFAVWLRIALSAARREPRVYDNHIRPQSDLVPKSAEVFRLEDGFDAMIARLDAVTGTTTPEIEVAHLLRRDGVQAPVTVTRADAELVGDFYAADYRRFGYDRPDPSEYNEVGIGLADWLVAVPLAKALVWKQRWDWVR